MPGTEAIAVSLLSVRRVGFLGKSIPELFLAERAKFGQAQTVPSWTNFRMSCFLPLESVEVLFSYKKRPGSRWLAAIPPTNAPV